MKEIILSNGSTVIVDDLDYNKYVKYNWYSSKGYAARRIRINGKRICQYLHIEIAKDIGLNVNNLIDHKDQNIKNNTRINLREATYSQNAVNSKLNIRNKSGYRGISFEKNGKLKVAFRYKKQDIYIGTYNTIKEAIIAYNRAIKLYFGEYAVLNKL